MIRDAVTYTEHAKPLIFSFFLINWLRLDNPSCNTQQVLTILGSSFSAASFLGVVAVSVDRFLAVHRHLRYQELVTHRRVVIVVTGTWVYSAFLSLMILWKLHSTRDLISTISAAFGLLSHLWCTSGYIKLYDGTRITFSPCKYEAKLSLRR